MKKEETELAMDFGEALERFARVNVKDLSKADNSPEKVSKATPFVKWVGGKRSIIDHLIQRLPKKISEYYEPFIGGAALYLESVDKIKSAHLIDNNMDLVITYNVVKNDPDKLIAILKEHESKHNEKYYYKVRSWHELQDPIEIAARLLYLNKTCFNGLFRVNKKGEFNVPVGKYVNPNIVQEKNIKACSKALKKAVITYGDFTDIQPNKGAFVYFDPPYHPLNATSSFTSYTKGDFNEQDQIRLRDFVVELGKKGVNVMLSNSKTPFILDLFKKGFNISTVDAPRNVNCKPNKRNSVEEVIITNY